MLKNPRDEAGHVLCPTCGAAISDGHTITVGRLAYHQECWRPTDEPEQQNAGRSVS
jgi:hypothetical protein